MIRHFVRTAVTTTIIDKEINIIRNTKLPKYYKTEDEAFLDSIKIVDNGVGIKNSKSSNKDGHQSYAMKITNERLMNITKIYKTNIDISIRDLSKFENGHGTEIKFLIPIKLLKGNND